MTTAFMRLLNNLFLHRQSVEDFDFQRDSLWGYLAALTFFILAIIISILWTIFDKRKGYPVLFRYMHTLTRYYLAYILFGYGIVKLFGNQFSPNSQNAMLYALSDLNPHQLFWSFMGTSKSYQIFAGLLEIIPAVLLLFRRTSTLGSVMAISILINVLMLNIGYDTRLKLVLFHLIIIAFFILAHDIKKLFQFFALKQNAALASIQPVIVNKRYKWAHYAIKFTLILFFLFLGLKSQINPNNEISSAPHGAIIGIHKIKEFHITHDSTSINKDNQLDWKKIAITPFIRFSVQFMNDSIATYFFASSPTSESLELVSHEDSSFSCKLHYSKIKPDEWLFNGTLKNDSVRFISTKIDLNNSTLLKDFGKTKWVY